MNERDKAKTASVYEAEITALNEELQKLKNRLSLLEVKDYYKDKDITVDSNDVITFNPNNTTVNRPKEVEEHVPWTGYVIINEDGESIDSCSVADHEELRTSSALRLKKTRIIKVKEIYEENGDV